MSPPSEPARAAGVFAAAGAFYAATVLPGLHWHDTAEFAAVARRLSLSHSPGHPLHALSTHGALQGLPLGDAAFRANLASGLAVALACALLFGLLRRAAPHLPWLGAAAAALLPAVMPAVWLQGARAEVYALQVALSVALGGCLWGVARGDGRALPAAALLFGLAGANQSVLGVALIPTALLAMAAGLRSLRPLLAAIPAGALGLATYAYLALRGAAGAEVGWGRPVTAADLWATISAREWRRFAGGYHLDLGENLVNLVGFFADQVTPAGALAGLLLIGLGALPAWRCARAPLLGGLTAAAGLIATKFYFSFDLLNPDLAGYFAGALFGLTLAAWTALGALVSPEGNAHRARWLALGFALPLGLNLAGGFDPQQRQGARQAGAYARALLAETPVGGALVTSDYTTTFLLWALRSLEGARPDVAVVFRGQVARPWFAARLATQAPAWAARLPHFPAGFDGPAVRFEPGVEGHRLGPLQARLAPQGWTLAPDAPAHLDPPPPLGPAPAVDLDSRRTLGLHHLERARHQLDHRPPAEARLARWHLTRARALAGDDPLIAELWARLPP